jgi:TonB family protein
MSAEPAMTNEPPVLAPASPWQVDYADEECRLLRTFGIGDDAVTLRIARGSGLQSFDMVVAGVKIPRLGSGVAIRVTMEPQGMSEDFEGYSMGVPNRPEKFIRWYDGDPKILATATNRQQVRLSADNRFDVAMLWTDAKSALSALQACHDDLLKSWGIEIDAMRNWAVPPEPIGSPGRWVTNADYPLEETRRGIEGTTAFQLKISPQGVIEKCIIVRSSKSNVLDRRSCQLMLERAKFKPAIGADGQPMASFYVNRVRWQVPK